MLIADYLFNVRSYCIDFSQKSGGFELASAITLVLHPNRLEPTRLKPTRQPCPTLKKKTNQITSKGNFFHFRHF